MYVCICNALTDRQVTAVIAQGVEDPVAIYAALGCQPQCGRCLATVHELVHRHRPLPHRDESELLIAAE